MGAFAGVTRLTRRNSLDAAAEQALIEQCRRQDMEAFGKIVDAYQARVLGFVRRMVHSQEEAEDLSQEVFVRAYQNFAKFDGRSSLRTWLFRIAHNLCVDAARKRGRVPQDYRLIDPEEDETIDVPDSRWNPEALVLDDEMRGVLEKALSTMSEKLRSVLLLHDREELGYEELAQTLDIPVGTVKSRLFLARAHLQNALQTYVGGGVS